MSIDFVNRYENWVNSIRENYIVIISTVCRKPGGISLFVGCQKKYNPNTWPTYIYGVMLLGY